MHYSKELEIRNKPTHSKAEIHLKHDDKMIYMEKKSFWIVSDLWQML